MFDGRSEPLGKRFIHEDQKGHEGRLYPQGGRKASLLNLAPILLDLAFFAPWREEYSIR